MGDEFKVLNVEFSNGVRPVSLSNICTDWHIVGADENGLETGIYIFDIYTMSQQEFINRVLLCGFTEENCRCSRSGKKCPPIPENFWRLPMYCLLGKEHAYIQPWAWEGNPLGVMLRLNPYYENPLLDIRLRFKFSNLSATSDKVVLAIDLFFVDENSTNSYPLMPNYHFRSYYNIPDGNTLFAETPILETFTDIPPNITFTTYWCELRLLKRDELGNSLWEGYAKASFNITISCQFTFGPVVP